MKCIPFVFVQIYLELAIFRQDLFNFPKQEPPPPKTKIFKNYRVWSYCNLCIKFHNARSSDMEIRNVSIRCYRNNIWNNLANSNDHNNNHNWTLVLDGKEK